MTNGSSARPRGAWRLGSALAAVVGVALVARGVVAGRRRVAAAPPYRVTGDHAGDGADGAIHAREVDQPQTEPTEGNEERDGASPDLPPDPSLSPDLPPDPPRDSGPRPRAPRLVVAAGVVALVVAALVARGVASNSETAETAGIDAGGQADREEGSNSTTIATTTTTIAAVTAAEGFALASDRLDTAGSFAYSGTAQATDVSHIRPSRWLATDVTVEGEVALSSDRMHEIAVAAAGVTETVADGPTVWGRSASTEAGLADQSFQVVTGLHQSQTLTRVGTALLPEWLGSATDHQAMGTDDQGRSTFSGTVPADEFGATVRGEPAVAAEILLSLDAAGDPFRVEISSIPGGSLHLALNISDIGEDVTIDVPDG